jgi:hypothetical protein
LKEDGVNAAAFPIGKPNSVGKQEEKLILVEDVEKKRVKIAEDQKNAIVNHGT